MKSPAPGKRAQKKIFNMFGYFKIDAGRNREVCNFNESARLSEVKEAC